MAGGAGLYSGLLEGLYSSGPKSRARTVPGPAPLSLQEHITWQHLRPMATAELVPWLGALQHQLRGFRTEPQPGFTGLVASPLHPAQGFA